MKKRFIIISLVAFVALLIFTPIAPALADCNVGNLLPPCTCSGQCKLTDFLALGSNIMQYGVGMLAAVAIGFFINAGYTLLMAMGNPEKIDAGKKQLGGTFKGVAIVMLAWVLVSTIIFFTTGNSSGLLFGRGEKWWQFKETPLHEMYLPHTPPPNQVYCPVRTSAPTPSAAVPCKYKLDFTPQVCTTVDFANTLGMATSKCRSLGVCPGGPERLCCDLIGAVPACPTDAEYKRYISGE
jgi:hypothetical protein